jgi:hypothetical protein
MDFNASLSSLVRHRARRACEYCRLPEAESDLAFTIDHIICYQRLGFCERIVDVAIACGVGTLQQETI